MEYDVFMSFENPSEVNRQDSLLVKRPINKLGVNYLYTSFAHKEGTADFFAVYTPESWLNCDI